jgi:hypothetical protein
MTMIDGLYFNKDVPSTVPDSQMAPSRSYTLAPTTDTMKSLPKRLDSFTFRRYPQPTPDYRASMISRRGSTSAHISRHAPFCPRGNEHAAITTIPTTRALDGMQSAEWGGLAAQWTYHPDTGMNLTNWTAS